MAAPQDMEPNAKTAEAETSSHRSLEAFAIQDGTLDVAARFYSTLDPAIRDEPISDKEMRRVRWKIDLIVVPVLAVATLLASLDKLALSNAAIYGMREDTHLTGDRYSLVGTLFFVGYALFEGPFAWAIQRLPVAKLLAVTVFFWGVLNMCCAATHNFPGIAVARFFMGGTEAIMYPVSSVMTTMWWTKKEQPVRIAIWFNQFSTIFSGLIAYGVGRSHHDIAKWREIFLIVGGISVAWAIVIFIFLPDSPVNCRWLDERGKFIAIERVKVNNTGMEEKHMVKWNQVWEAVVDPKTWLLVTFGTAQNIINGGLNTFAAIIVSEFGFNKEETVLLGMPTGVIGTAWQVILAVICAHTVNKRCVIIATANLLPLLCAVLLWQLPRSNKHGLLAAYLLFYSYFGSYVLASSLPMANTSGHSKKVTMNAFFFASYALGNLIGPQVFRANDAPTYIRGYTGLTCVCIVSIVAISLYGLCCWNENRLRDKAFGEANQESMQQTQAEAAFSDKTDKEKPWFRYSY
ncbi:MFS-type transporter cnsL [Exophiala dermatitidis]